MSVIIETSVGDLTIDLLIEERPKCCYNFIKLCKMKYYNFCGFHRLEKDFIAQSGDPSGTGEGGQSIFAFLHDDDKKSSKFFSREMVPKVNHTRLGTVSMVNNGDDMHGSQFFFTLRENLDYLDGVHTVFGYVVEGLETLTKMNELFFSDIIITHTVIIADPFDDPPDLIEQLPDSSPEPSEEIIRRMCIAHNIDEKPEEDAKVQESRAAATILEMIGDLPSEDIKPPDNVLFVCKLNPVTKEEDLIVIFSRFGPISECEIIRDHKTGDSLQYAFIEFENVEDCEKAYFKMDNVLIDDRRIHVDFSQSVAKYKWNRKSDKNQGNRHAKSEAKDGSPSGSRKHETPQDRRYENKHEGYSKDQRRNQKGYSRDKDMSKRNEYPRDEYRRQEKDRDRDRNRDSRRDDYRKRDRESHRERRYDKEESHHKRRDRSRSRDHHRDRVRDRGHRKDHDKDYDKDIKRDREKTRDKDRDRLRDRSRDRGKSNRH